MSINTITRTCPLSDEFGREGCSEHTVERRVENELYKELEARLRDDPTDPDRRRRSAFSKTVTETYFQGLYAAHHGQK
jgi:hypothetical protein